MKHFLSLAAVLLVVLGSVSSCVREEEYDNSCQGNFEALWKILDERYCFFDYKREALGVDWDEVHARYAQQVNEGMTQTQLFEVLCNMLAELQDGHVNLSTSFDFGRNWSFFEDYPEEYNDSIARLYLAHDYRISTGLRYRILDDNIGYVRCESFDVGIGSGNVSNVLSHFALCTGMIIDVRGNGGGQLTSSRALASHFTNERTLVGYVSHKTGPGRSDFSRPEEVWVDAAMDGLRWQKPVVVLTNRGVFSAANDFVNCMRCFPQVTIMGDRTGGGSGMPFNSELPNGWTVRYSAVVFFDADMQQIEFGIAPDVPLSMSGADIALKKDTYIEKAREYLRMSR